MCDVLSHIPNCCILWAEALPLAASVLVSLLSFGATVPFVLGAECHNYLLVEQMFNMCDLFIGIV